MKVKHLADEKHRSIGILKSSGDMLKQKISDLLAKREALLAELKQVEEVLSQAQQEESQLPEMIKTLKQERNIQARKTLQMKKKLKPVEGTADEDIKEIEETDQIRLRYIGDPSFAECISFSLAMCFALSSKIADYFGLADRTVIGIF